MREVSNMVAKLPPKRCFSTQNGTRFLTTVSSQRQAIPIDTSLVNVIFMVRVLTYVVSYEPYWNWNGVVRFVSPRAWGLIRPRVRYLPFSSLLRILYKLCRCNHWVLEFEISTPPWIGRQNKKLGINCITEWLKWRRVMKKRCRRPDFFMKQNAPQTRLIIHNAPEANIFDWILMGRMSYSYGM